MDENYTSQDSIMGRSRLEYLIRNAEIGNDNVQENDEQEVENHEEVERTQHLIDVLHLDIPEDNHILPGRVYVLPRLNSTDQAGEMTERFSSTPIVNEMRPRRSRLRWFMSRFNPFKKR